MPRACDLAKRTPEWGARMLRRRGFLRQQALYPELLTLWRMNGTRASRGLPLLPVPDLTGIARHPRPPERRSKAPRLPAAP